MLEIDEEIVQALLNPAYEVNWKSVMKALRIIAQLATAIVPGAGPAVSGVLGTLEGSIPKK